LGGEMLRQEDQEFKVRLGYIVRKKNKNKPAKKSAIDRKKDIG
jgi:hypothetical protein